MSGLKCSAEQNVIDLFEFWAIEGFFSFFFSRFVPPFLEFAFYLFGSCLPLSRPQVLKELFLVYSN